MFNRNLDIRLQLQNAFSDEDDDFARRSPTWRPHRLLTATANLRASKMVQYDVLTPPAASIVAAKMAQYDVLVPPVASIIAAKMVQYTVLGPGIVPVKSPMARQINRLRWDEDAEEPRVLPPVHYLNHHTSQSAITQARIHWADIETWQSQTPKVNLNQALFETWGIAPSSVRVNYAGLETWFNAAAAPSGAVLNWASFENWIQGPTAVRLNHAVAEVWVREPLPPVDLIWAGLEVYYNLSGVSSTLLNFAMMETWVTVPAPVVRLDQVLMEVWIPVVLGFAIPSVPFYGARAAVYRAATIDDLETEEALKTLQTRRRNLVSLIPATTGDRLNHAVWIS